MTAKIDLEDLILALRDARTVIKGKAWLEVRALESALQSALVDTANWKSQFQDDHTGAPITRWDLAGKDERRVLDETPLPNPVGCPRCSWLMTTEGEYQRHFVVDSLRYPNLGSCWTKDYLDYKGTRPEWTLDHLTEEQARDLR